jgi:hypothetical protein
VDVLRTQQQRMLRFSMLCGIASAALSSGPSHAFGADSIPPPWRGNEGTTYQSWSFDTAGNPAVPESISNPYGDPIADITVGAFGSGWLSQLPGLGTPIGYWDIGGEGGRIVIVLYPLPRPLAYHQVWVQVTYFADISQPPIVDVDAADRVSGQTVAVEQIPGGGAWYLEQSLWQIEPPQRHGEPIVLTSEPLWGALVDQIVVDTDSVQLPGCNVPFADADGDGDVDQVDFAIWQSCVTGEHGGVLAGCDCFDRDNDGVGDGDVDDQDLEAFEACASGPGIPADPACDERTQ